MRFLLFILFTTMLLAFELINVNTARRGRILTSTEWILIAVNGF